MHFITIQVSTKLDADRLVSRGVCSEDTRSTVQSEVMDPVNVKCNCSSNWTWCCSCWKHLSHSFAAVTGCALLS